MVQRVDDFQRRHAVIGYPLAVIYKFFDDQGPYLSAIITYYAFIAIFPVMLMASSILGFVLQGDAALSQRLLNSALAQFPIIGDELGRPGGLHGSRTAIIVGAIAALYGSLGLGQSSQNASNIAWAVPRNSRANPFLMRLRSLLFLMIGGAGILAISVVTSMLANPGSFAGSIDSWLGWVIRFAGFVVTAIVFIGLFRLVSAGRASTRSVLPGALASAVMWQLLQAGGNAFVTHVLQRADAMNKTFALVLGLVGFIYIAAIMVVIGLEINVVLRRKFYPRALLTPFTDNVKLTDADVRAYRSYAQAQRHKGFQTVEVSFEDRDTG